MSNQRSLKQSTMELFHNNPGLLDELHDKLLSKDFQPVKGIYFDLTTLKDMRLGTMLYLAKDNAKDISYMRDNLKKYEYRSDRSFMKLAFPDYTSATEEELINFYNSGFGTDEVFDRSPDTVLLQQIGKLINHILSQNWRSEHRQPPTIYINTYPFDESVHMRTFKIFMEDYLGSDIKIQYIKHAHNNLPLNLILSCDMFFIDDISPWILEGNPLYNAFIVESEFEDKQIYAHPVVDEKIRDEWESKGADLSDPAEFLTFMEPTKIYFDIICKFKYMIYNIVTS